MYIFNTLKTNYSFAGAWYDSVKRNAFLCQRIIIKKKTTYEKKKYFAKISSVKWVYVLSIVLIWIISNLFFSSVLAGKGMSI